MCCSSKPFLCSCTFLHWLLVQRKADSCFHTSVVIEEIWLLIAAPEGQRKWGERGSWSNLGQCVQDLLLTHAQLWCPQEIPLEEGSHRREMVRLNPQSTCLFQNSNETISSSSTSAYRYFLLSQPPPAAPAWAGTPCPLRRGQYNKSKTNLLPVLSLPPWLNLWTNSCRQKQSTISMTHSKCTGKNPKKCAI